MMEESFDFVGIVCSRSGCLGSNKSKSRVPSQFHPGNLSYNIHLRNTLQLPSRYLCSATGCSGCDAARVALGISRRANYGFGKHRPFSKYYIWMEAGLFSLWITCLYYFLFYLNKFYWVWNYSTHSNQYWRSHNLLLIHITVAYVIYNIDNGGHLTFCDLEC